MRNLSYVPYTVWLALFVIANMPMVSQARRNRYSDNESEYTNGSQINNNRKTPGSVASRSELSDSSSEANERNRDVSSGAGSGLASESSMDFSRGSGYSSQYEQGESYQGQYNMQKPSQGKYAQEYSKPYQEKYSKQKQGKYQEYNQPYQDQLGQAAVE